MTLYNISEVHENEITDYTNMVYFQLDTKLPIKSITPGNVEKIQKISEIQVVSLQ